MKALLDTHTFLWAITGDSRLSRKAQQIFIGPSDLMLSAASIWEILIKEQTGKMSLPVPTGPYLVKEMIRNNVEMLPISLDHVLQLESLPLYHRDPFDRLLIAQSIEEGWPIVTADPWFARYRVEVIW